jgi:hypothetical protein
MVATEPCPVCGSVDAHPVVSRRGFSYVRCSHCRAVYVSPMPLAEEVARIYQDLPYFAGNTEIGYGDYAAMHKALAPHFADGYEGWPRFSRSAAGYWMWAVRMAFSWSWPGLMAGKWPEWKSQSQ